MDDFRSVTGSMTLILAKTPVSEKIATPIETKINALSTRSRESKVKITKIKHIRAPTRVTNKPILVVSKKMVFRVTSIPNKVAKVKATAWCLETLNDGSKYNAKAVRKATSSNRTFVSDSVIIPVSIP
jgi:hypothetical protein